MRNFPHKYGFGVSANNVPWPDLPLSESTRVIYYEGSRLTEINVERGA